MIGKRIGIAVHTESKSGPIGSTVTTYVEVTVIDKILVLSHNKQASITNYICQADNGDLYKDVSPNNIRTIL